MTVRRWRADEQGGIRGRGAAAAALALVAVGLLARATLADTSATSYRTATVTRATVLQTLTRVGTIEPVAQATVAFPDSGTVAGVSAKVGDTVTTGQTLASLDTTTQASELTTRQAALAAAQLTLDQAVNGQAASGSSTSTNSRSAPTADRLASVDLTPAQQQVLNGQKGVDTDLRSAETAVATVAEACGAPSSPVPTSPAAPNAARPAPSATVPATTTTTVAPSGLGSTACSAAQQQAMTAQQTVAARLRSLADAETALDGALARAVESSASTTSSSPSSGSSSGGSSPSTGNASGAVAASSQAAPTAAQLVADQAAVDAADAAVRAAQQTIDQATVVSPIAGTVAAVNLVPGQQVSAASSTANVVVVGEGGWEVSTTVGVDAVDKVKVGQTATVLADGAGTSIDAKVVTVGVAAATSGTTTTYPVVVGFTVSTTGLHNGASASVVIELAQAADALTVPTSAVRTAGTLHVVAVLSGGKSRTVPVQVGTVGSERTEVTSGLSAGQAVVLADLNQALPASNTNTGGGLGSLSGGSLSGGGGGIRTGRGPG